MLALPRFETTLHCFLGRRFTACVAAPLYGKGAHDTHYGKITLQLLMLITAEKEDKYLKNKYFFRIVVPAILSKDRLSASRQWIVISASESLDF